MFPNCVPLAMTGTLDVYNNFGIAKPDKYKTLSDINSTIKQWTDGFSLNASVAVFF